MKHALKKIDIIVLRKFANANSPLDIGHLGNSFSTSISDVMQSLASLKENGFVELIGDHLRLTKMGREFVYLNQHLFSHKGEKHWRSVPSSFTGPSLLPREPYAPRRSMLARMRRQTRH